MKNLFRWATRPADTARVSLDVHRTPGAQPAQIEYPDLHHPAPHTANTVDPHEQADAYRDRVRAQVAALAASGALDEDTPTSLAHEIDAWRRTWEQRAVQHAEQRRRTAALLLAQTQQDLARTRSGLRHSRARRMVLRDLEAGLLDTIGLPGAPRETTPSSADLEQLLHASDATLEPSLSGRYLPLLAEPPARITTTNTSKDAHR